MEGLWWNWKDDGFMKKVGKWGRWESEESVGKWGRGQVCGKVEHLWGRRKDVGSPGKVEGLWGKQERGEGGKVDSLWER